MKVICTCESSSADCSKKQILEIFHEVAHYSISWHKNLRKYRLLRQSLDLLHSSSFIVFVSISPRPFDTLMNYLILPVSTQVQCGIYPLYIISIDILLVLEKARASPCHNNKQKLRILRKKLHNCDGSFRASMAKLNKTDIDPLQLCRLYICELYTSHFLTPTPQPAHIIQNYSSAKVYLLFSIVSRFLSLCKNLYRNNDAGKTTTFCSLSSC